MITTREELDRLREFMFYEARRVPESAKPEALRVAELLESYQLPAAEGERAELAHSLACEIAGDLFSNGSAEVADRLVLERGGASSYLGTWSIGAATTRIEERLRASSLLTPHRRGERRVRYGGLELTDVAVDDQTLLAELMRRICWPLLLPCGFCLYLVKGEGARVAEPPRPPSALGRWKADRDMALRETRS